MVGDAAEQDGALLAEGRGDEDEVLGCEGGQDETMGCAQVLVALVGRPGSTVHLATVFLAVPGQSDLLLPLVVLVVVDSLLLEVKDNVPHVGKEAND